MRELVIGLGAIVFLLLSPHQAEILSLFQAYALHAYDWEPAKEDDWEDIKDSIFVILYENQLEK